MALILHTNWFKGSYKEDRDFIIRMGENDKLYKGVKRSGESWVFGTRPYSDGSIAIGYGFDLLRNSPEYIAHFLGTVGITVSATQIKTIQKKSGGPTLADFAFLDLGSEATARMLMDNVLDSQNNQFKGKEKLLNDLFSGLGIVIGDSKERAVLVSMYYQAGSKYFGTTTNPSNMTRSLQSDNRAEAWYEIRYGSSKNGADGDGVVVRRFAESKIFGLYNDPANVGAVEAKQVYRTFTLHRSRIADYEKRFGVAFDGSLGSKNLIAQATTHYGLTGANVVDYIHDALNPAYQSLFADLQSKYPVGMAGLSAADFNPVNVYLDPGRDNTKQSIDPNNHAAYLYSAVDPLTGAELVTRDILIGEGGNDVLYGGKGDDLLIGGTGLDYYIWNTGDGNDRIIDEDRRGIIVINNGAHDLYASGAFVKQGSTNVWKKITPEGVLTLTHNSPWKIVTADGSEILLGDDFADSDFGIHLVEESTPTTTLHLTGDLAPLDTDPTESGLQDDYDSLHNLLVTGDAQPRPDILYGSAGNDRLQGYSGTDYLAGKNGDDLLEGGTGNDALAGGQGADTLKGEDGNDILLGDHELATVDSYDHTADGSLLAAITRTPDGSGGLVHSYQIDVGVTPSPAVGGADRIEGGIGDDLVFAGGGGDHIDGGEGADVVFGEGGNDLIEGGAHDDILVGDSYGAGVPYGDDVLLGGAGNDWLYGTGGHDYLEGGEGNDVLLGDGNGTADAGNDILLGGEGNDSFYGGGGDDLLLGGAGDDILRGEDGDDVLIGGEGNDTLQGGEGDDAMVGVGTWRMAA